MRKEYKDDLNKLVKVVGNLVIRNMEELGMSYETAKKAALARLEKEVPGALDIFRALAVKNADCK